VVRSCWFFWAALTASALIVHFAVTGARWVAVAYIAAGLFVAALLDQWARRRLARAAGIVGRGPRAVLKRAMIEFAVDGLSLPPEVTREFLRARRTSVILSVVTFAVFAVLVAL
jgi:hypothetical protein